MPPEHYLWKLWERVRKLIVQIDNRSGDNAWVKRAGQIIKEFDGLDPRSYAFRYPITNTGMPSLKNEMLVDPAVVAQIMSELFLLLDGASEQVSVYEGYKQDMYDS